MKKYIWTYQSPSISIRENNIEKLCEKINSIENLQDKNKITKWLVHNTLQKKIKKPRDIVLRISRRQI